MTMWCCSAVGREQYVSDDDEVVDAGYEIQDADAQEDADGVSSLLSAMDSDDTFGDEDSERRRGRVSYATFDAIKIGIASPEMIRQWSYGEVKKPETINYRTLKPERDGLFCEKIFGPTKDWECHCGKYKKIRYKGKICDRCGVEVTQAKVRRERMGHIELAAPCQPYLVFQGHPLPDGSAAGYQPPGSGKGSVLCHPISSRIPGDAPLTKNQILSEKEYRDMREKYEDDFDAGMGAEAVKKLLAGHRPGELCRKQLRSGAEDCLRPEEAAAHQASGSGRGVPTLRQ